MVRRRNVLKRRIGKKKSGRRRRKKRKFKRRKRTTATTAASSTRPNTVESVRKAFIRNLGIDTELQRAEFSAVIPEL